MICRLKTEHQARPLCMGQMDPDTVTIFPPLHRSRGTVRVKYRHGRVNAGLQTGSSPPIAE
jgi:hypothetical protein